MKISSMIKLGLAGLLTVIILVIVSGSFYTIDEGERGVVTRQGKIVSVAQPGLHFKTPMIEEVHRISTRTQAIVFLDEPVYTADRQTANIAFSVNYAVLPTDAEVIKLYREFQTIQGLESRVLTRQIKERVKNVFGQFTAESAIRERGRLNTEVTSVVSNIGDNLIRVEGVNFENINFSDAVEKAAEARARAEMDTNTRREEQKKAIVDNEMSVAEAKAKADSQFAVAEAEAKGIKLKGEADAAAIRAKSEALRESPNLIELTKAQNWDGKLPQQFVPGSAIPFLNLK